MKTARVVVDAGSTARQACMISVPMHQSPEDPVSAAQVLLEGKPIPSEFAHQNEDGTGGVLFLVEALAADESRTFELQTWGAGEAPPAGAPDRIVLSDTGSVVEITIEGEPFTTYHYHEKMVKPSFSPLLAGGGLAVTRAFPMQDGTPEDDKDHPHHRGLWVAHGDVNGVDLWNEAEGHGWAAHASFDNLASGPLLGQMDAKTRWHSAEGVHLLTEWRKATIFTLDNGLRVLDLDVHLSAGQAAVTLGDTKEAGLCAVRVASSMRTAQGGKIVNAEGKTGEKQTWGVRSPWCDYSGPVGSGVAGVTIMDHPDNLRYPTYWHVRDYGLMAANPFGISHFTGDSAQNGSHQIPQGESVLFRYRVLIHTGDAAQTNIAGYYTNWIDPPHVRTEAGE